MVISILIHIHGCNSCLLCFQFFQTSILILIQGCNVKTRRLMVHVNFNTHPHTRMQRQDYQEHSLQKFQYSSPCEDATENCICSCKFISILIPIQGCNSDRYSYIHLPYTHTLPHKRAFFNKQFIEKPHIFQPSVLSCTCNKNFGCIQLI